MNIGDKVTPKSGALWLAKVPVNGDYHQRREGSVIFSGVGEIIDTNTCQIDYDEWDRIRAEETGDAPYNTNLGIVTYQSVLIKTGNSEGWAGAGAVVLVP